MFAITVLLAIMGLIATDVFVPSLPSIGLAFQQPLNYTQLTISLFLVGFAFSQLFYGPISDRTGRKGPLLVGVILFIIGSIVCVWTDSFVVFCIGRVLQGLGVGGGLSLSRVVIRDCYQGVALSVKTAQMATFISLTPAVAPFIGGLLQEGFGFRSVFIFLLAYGLLLLFLLLFCFKETIAHKHSTWSLPQTIKNYGALLSNFQFIHYVVISGIAFSSIILYANIVPFIIQTQMHLSARTNGAILLLAALGVSMASLISSKVVHCFAPRKLLAVGLASLVFGGLLLIFTERYFGLSLWTLTPLIFLITLACGFLLPNAVGLAFGQIEVNIGSAGAIYGFTQIFTAMMLNFLLNLIPDAHQGQTLLGLFYVVLGLIGLGLLVMKQRRVK